MYVFKDMSHLESLQEAEYIMRYQYNWVVIVFYFYTGLILTPSVYKSLKYRCASCCVVMNLTEDYYGWTYRVLD